MERPQEEIVAIGRPDISLDLRQQLKLTKRHTILQKKIFRAMKEIALERCQQVLDPENEINSYLGALVVLGQYTKSDYVVPGMRQIHRNPLEGTKLLVSDKNLKEELIKLFDLDGALVIDEFGQVLAARVYIQVDHGEVEVDEECSTRHITAASISQREDIIAAFTISEETGKARWYLDGKQEDHFDPELALAVCDEEEDDEEGDESSQFDDDED